MTSPRASRTPLVSLLVVGTLAVVACSDSGDVISSPYSRHTYPTGSSGAAGSTGSGASSAGNGGSTASTGNTSGSGATSGSSTGSTGSSNTGGSTGSTSGNPGSGDTGGGGAPTQPTQPTQPAPAPPTFTVSVASPSTSMNLADTTTLAVTVTSTNQWAGSVTLSTESLPTGVTGTFDNATVTVGATTPGTANLTLKSESSTAPAATPFSIDGTVSAVVEKASATLTVNPSITIHIPVNADSMTTSFGTVTITAPADIATNPVTVNFVNDDSTQHEVHAENPNQGFAHGQGTFGQGQADTPVRHVTAKGTYSWHLHDDAPPAGPPGGKVVIQ